MRHGARLAGASHETREGGWLFESGDPTGDPIDYSVVFSAGTFHFFCETHGGPLGGAVSGRMGPVANLEARRDEQQGSIREGREAGAAS